MGMPDTVRTADATFYFRIEGIYNATGSQFSATVNGVAVPYYNGSWQGTPGGHEASAMASVTLAAGANTVVGTFCPTGQGCVSASAQTYYKAPPPPPVQGAPIAVAEPVSQFGRSFGTCAGCAYTTLSYSTPAYHSRDQDRSLSLAYSSATSAPVGLVALDVNPNSSTLPDRISLALVYGSAYMSLKSGGTEVYYTAGSGSNRVSAAFDASSFATGAYHMTAVVRSWWGGSFIETQLPVRVFVINDRLSGFGSGWSVSGLQRLSLQNGISEDAAIIDGTGITVFPTCGAACWSSPPGRSDTFVYLPGNGTFEHRYRDGTVMVFNAATGFLQQAHDRLGVTTSFLYDGYGRLSQVTDPAGFVTTIAWTGAPGGSGTATITTPGGRVSRVDLDASGQVIDIYDPDNVRALATSYTSNRIVSVTNRIGGTTSFNYDVFGGLSAITEPSRTTTDLGTVSPVTTIRSREMTLLPATGTGNSATPPAARVFADSVWLISRGPRGDSTRVVSNGAGEATYVATRNPQGKVESSTTVYNDAGQPLNVTSTSGTRVSYGWSGPDLLTITDLATGVTSGFSYNALGQMTVSAVEGVAQVTNTYTTDGRSVLQSSVSGTSTTQYTFDAIGRALSVVDGAGHTTSFTYGPSGGFQNLATVTKNSHTTTLSYDSFGRGNGGTDALGRTATTTFDVMNRATHAVAPDLSASNSTYDDVNRSYLFTDAASQSYHTVLNAAGQPISRTDPRGLSDRFGYNSKGDPTTDTSRTGRVVTTTYDVIGRPTLVVGSDGVTTTIAYDTASRWTAYQNAESIDTLFTDGAGRPTLQVTIRGGQRYTVLAGYGDVGERSSVNVGIPAWNGGTAEAVTGVDGLGRPHILSDFGGRATTLNYNTDQQMQSVVVPTTGVQLTRTFGYGANDRLQVATANQLQDQLTWDLSYDALDRLHVSTQGTAGASLQRTTDYDVAGRLSHWTDAQTTSGEPYEICPDQMDLNSCYWTSDPITTTVRQDSYTYDAVGNRTDKGGSTQTGNRLVSFNGYTIGYDNDGNMVSKVGNGVTQSFAWNSFGQLTSVTTNGSTTSFYYDGLGRRARKVGPSGTTMYLNDGGNLVMELDGSGQPLRRYTYYPGVDHPLAVTLGSPAATYYYMADPSGSVMGLVNVSIQQVNQYSYTPFGQTVTATEQVAQPFRYAGRELDAETGLYYNRARYYDPALGRFLSEDPIGMAGGVNPYVYAGNDPVNFSDPAGLHSGFRDTDCMYGSERLVIDVEALTVTSSCEEGSGGVSIRGSGAGGGGGFPSDFGNVVPSIGPVADGPNAIDAPATPSGPSRPQTQRTTFGQRFRSCGVDFVESTAIVVATATAVALPFTTSAAITVVPGGVGIATGYATLSAEGLLGALGASSVAAPATAIVGGLAIGVGLYCLTQAMTVPQ